MSKTDDDKAYQNGVKDGQSDGWFFNMLHDVIPAPGRHAEIYSKGYEWGRAHRGSSANDSASRDSDTGAASDYDGSSDYGSSSSVSTVSSRRKSHWGVFVLLGLAAVVVIIVAVLSQSNSQKTEYYTGQKEEWDLQAGVDFPLPPLMGSGMIYHVLADKPITVSTLSGHYPPVQVPAGTDYSCWRANLENPSDVIVLRASENQTHVKIFRYVVR